MHLSGGSVAPPLELRGYIGDAERIRIRAAILGVARKLTKEAVFITYVRIVDMAVADIVGAMAVEALPYNVSQRSYGDNILGRRKDESVVPIEPTALR